MGKTATISELKDILERNEWAREFGHVAHEEYIYAYKSYHAARAALAIRENRLHAENDKECIFECGESLGHINDLMRIGLVSEDDVRRYAVPFLFPNTCWWTVWDNGEEAELHRFNTPSYADERETLPQEQGEIIRKYRMHNDCPSRKGEECLYTVRIDFDENGMTVSVKRDEEGEDEK